MKKDKKSIQWLYSEIPELVEENIISEDSANKLKARYGEITTTDPVKIALIIFGIIGSVLIGGGIILILAHNWADMPRPVRAVFSFLPLIAAQLIAGYTLFKKNESTAWRESSGAFLMLALGSSIALIGQTYHVSGNLGSFLFTWMLLSLPVIYLLNCTTAGMFYLGGIIFWMGYILSENGNPAFFLAFLVIFAPYMVIQILKNRYSLKTTLLIWGLAIILPIAAGMGIDYMNNEDLWYIGFTAIFAIFYLVGNLWFDQVRFPWRKPLQTIGVMGIFVMTIILTYDDVWRWFDIGNVESIQDITGISFYLALLSITSVLLGIAIFKKLFSLLFFGIIPILSVICGIISGALDAEIFAMVIFNIYMAVLGISTIVHGIKTDKLGNMNAGMFILSVLILMRFFDSDANILLKGVAFIIIGIAFLVTNILIVIRQRKKLKNIESKSI